MTTTTMHLIVGQSLIGWEDCGEEELCEQFGVDSIEGLEMLYQGHTYVGVEVRTILDQYSITKLEDLDLSIPDDVVERARSLCNALPDTLKNNRGLMPFGAYILSSDG